MIVLLCCWLITACPHAFAQEDISLLRSIQSHRSTASDKVMSDISTSIYPVVTTVCLTQLIYGYAAHDKAIQLKGWQMTAGIGFTAIVTYGLKYSVNRKRPYQTYSDIIPYESRATDPSFPSGHTSFAFSMATTLSLQYKKWYVVAPTYLYAGAVGYSRLHLGKHYPSDVLIGAITGMGSAWLGYKGVEWLHHRRQRSTPVTPAF
jgi:undecaprenyl-diphosphatase